MVRRAGTAPPPQALDRHLPVTPATLLAWHRKNWPRRGTTQAGGASPAARRPSRASTCGCRKRMLPGRMRRGGHGVSARAWRLVAGLRAGGRWRCRLSYSRQSEPIGPANVDKPQPVAAQRAKDMPGAPGAYRFRSCCSQNRLPAPDPARCHSTASLTSARLVLGKGFHARAIAAMTAPASKNIPPPKTKTQPWY